MSVDRYNFSNNTKRNSFGKEVYSSILYPIIRKSASDIYIMAKDSDRLDLIAYKYYGDVTLWWVIAKANGIKGTFFVPVGMQIRIPQDIATIQYDTAQLNKDSV